MSDRMKYSEAVKIAIEAMELERVVFFPAAISLAEKDPGWCIGAHIRCFMMADAIATLSNPWIPMESAPRDGGYILLIDGAGEVNKAAWRKNDSYAADIERSMAWCVYGSYQTDQGGWETVDNPVGWMYLPGAPEVKK